MLLVLVFVLVLVLVVVVVVVVVGGGGGCWLLVVGVVGVVGVVVGTNKDWGPRNKVPELILEFARCSLRASMEYE